VGKRKRPTSSTALRSRCVTHRACPPLRVLRAKAGRLLELALTISPCPDGLWRAGTQAQRLMRACGWRSHKVVAVLFMAALRLLVPKARLPASSSAPITTNMTSPDQRSPRDLRR
jgi:hypothetical protein